VVTWLILFSMHYYNWRTFFPFIFPGYFKRLDHGSQAVMTRFWSGGGLFQGKVVVSKRLDHGSITPPDRYRSGEDPDRP